MALPLTGPVGASRKKEHKKKGPGRNRGLMM
jgi:hypothetical protein